MFNNYEVNFELIFGNSMIDSEMTYWCDIITQSNLRVVQVKMFVMIHILENILIQNPSLFITDFMPSPDIENAIRIIIPRNLDKNSSKLYGFMLMLDNNEKLFSKLFNYIEELNKFIVICYESYPIFKFSIILTIYLFFFTYLAPFYNYYLVNKFFINYIFFYN